MPCAVRATQPDGVRHLTTSDTPIRPRRADPRSTFWDTGARCQSMRRKCRRPSCPPGVRTTLPHFPLGPVLFRLESAPKQCCTRGEARARGPTRAPEICCPALWISPGLPSEPGVCSPLEQSADFATLHRIGGRPAARRPGSDGRLWLIRPPLLARHERSLQAHHDWDQTASRFALLDDSSLVNLQPAHIAREIEGVRSQTLLSSHLFRIAAVDAYCAQAALMNDWVGLTW
jgi:hypothetical protein